MTIEKLDWDSDFFNLKIGKIVPSNLLDAEKMLRQAKSEEYDLVYCFDHSCNLAFPQKTLKVFNGKMVDTKVIFHWTTNLEDAALTTVNLNAIELYKQHTIVPTLEQLAFDSGIYSRFKIDANFKQNDFERLYTKWIENTIDRPDKSYLFTYKEDELITGFITLDMHKDIPSIGLIAVNSAYRGKKIGQKLLVQVKKTALENGYLTLSVATQKNNQLAYNFYLKNNFKEHSQTNIHHFWIKNS